jgi:hypothetical protein
MTRLLLYGLAAAVVIVVVDQAVCRARRGW